MIRDPWPVVTTWFRLFGPARIPPEIVNRLQAEARKVVLSPDIARRLEADGADPVASHVGDSVADDETADRIPRLFTGHCGAGSGLPGGGGGGPPAGAPVYCPGTGTRCPFAYMHWM